MTPEGLIDELGALIAGQRDREAIELTSQYFRALAPAMTPEQIARVAELAHVAQMTVDLEEWQAARGQAAEAQTKRLA